MSTRPVERNGFGLSIQETYAHVQFIETTMTVLFEGESVYGVWRRLLLAHNVRGVQVYDAHLASVLEVNGVSHLLTFNDKDFKRFPNVIAVHSQRSTGVSVSDGKLHFLN